MQQFSENSVSPSAVYHTVLKTKTELSAWADSKNLKALETVKWRAGQKEQPLTEAHSIHGPPAHLSWQNSEVCGPSNHLLLVFKRGGGNISLSKIPEEKQLSASCYRGNWYFYFYINEKWKLTNEISSQHLDKVKLFKRSVFVRALFNLCPTRWVSLWYSGKNCKQNF